MKKIIIGLGAAAVVLTGIWIYFSFFRHEHQWTKATCYEPMTCIICGETVGDPSNHIWIAATCQTPRTCMKCGRTEGDLGDHFWLEATELLPKRCEICGLTDGEPLPVHEGDCVEFGKYRKYYEPMNAKGEPIEWLVLEVRENAALLISRYVLPNLFEPGIQYQSQDDRYHLLRPSWDRSDLRTYLRHTFTDCFSSIEQSILLNTDLEPEVYSYDLKPAGDKTDDRFFVMSVSEAEKYFPTEEERKCTLAGDADWHFSWWLRTPGSESVGNETYVDWSGKISEVESPGSISVGFRPAVWVSLDVYSP